jgi:hypothetical protein
VHSLQQLVEVMGLRETAQSLHKTARLLYTTAQSLRKT